MQHADWLQIWSMYDHLHSQEKEMEKQKILYQQARLHARGAAEMVLQMISASKGKYIFCFLVVLTLCLLIFTFRLIVLKLHINSAGLLFYFRTTWPYGDFYSETGHLYS